MKKKESRFAAACRSQRPSFDLSTAALQVNISGEESKEGMSLAEAPELARQIVTLPHIEVQGLMTIAPLVKDPEEARFLEGRLRELERRLQSR